MTIPVLAVPREVMLYEEVGMVKLAEAVEFLVCGFSVLVSTGIVGFPVYEPLLVPVPIPVPNPVPVPLLVPVPMPVPDPEGYVEFRDEGGRVKLPDGDP